LIFVFFPLGDAVNFRGQTDGRVTVEIYGSHCIRCAGSQWLSLDCIQTDRITIPFWGWCLPVLFFVGATTFIAGMNLKPFWN